MDAERAPRGDGFTLLEVVVALAIAALALVGLFQAGSGGLFAVDTAARAEEAVQRAQSHLAAVGRDAALVQGDFTDDDGGGYRWRLRVRPVMQPSDTGAGRQFRRDNDPVRCRGRNLVARTAAATDRWC